MESDNTFGLKRTLRTGCGKIHFQAFYDKETGSLTDIFCPIGSHEKLCSNFVTMSRMMTLALSKGATGDEVIDQLHSSTPCPDYIVRTRIAKDTSKGTSCSGAMAYALQEMQKDAVSLVENGHMIISEPKEKPIIQSCTFVMPKDPEPKPNINPCPECGSGLANIGGCMTCGACGWSRCD